MRHKSKSLRSPARKAKPGSKGSGEYYHVELEDSADFEDFRVQDVGREGHTQRVAGRRPDGTWDTQKWLISKEDARLEGGSLVSDDPDVREILEDLGSVRHLEGDRFRAAP